MIDDMVERDTPNINARARPVVPAPERWRISSTSSSVSLAVTTEVPRGTLAGFLAVQCADPRGLVHGFLMDPLRSPRGTRHGFVTEPCRCPVGRRSGLVNAPLSCPVALRLRRTRSAALVFTSPR